MESKDFKEDKKPGVVWEPPEGEVGKSGDKRKGKKYSEYIVLGPKRSCTVQLRATLHLRSRVLWAP